MESDKFRHQVARNAQVLRYNNPDISGQGWRVLMRRNWPFYLTVLVLAALFILAEEEFSRAFGQCVAEWTQNDGKAATNPKGLNIAGFLESRAICTVHLIDKHNGFFAAIAAFIIAWFTWTLKESTDTLWSVTNDTLVHSQKTAERQLRAYVYLEVSGRKYPPPPKVPDRYSVSLVVKNSGVTWARNVRIKHLRAVDPDGDAFEAAKWDDINPRPILIGPNQEVQMQFGDLSGDELQDIDENHEGLFSGLGDL